MPKAEKMVRLGPQAESLMRLLTTHEAKPNPRPLSPTAVTRYVIN